MKGVRQFPNFNTTIWLRGAVDATNDIFKDLVCESPSQLVSFGLFLPIKKFPTLSIYNFTLDFTILQQVKINLERTEEKSLIWADPESFLIKLPRFYYWFMNDLILKSEDIESTL